VRVFENIEGSRFSLSLSHTINVSLTDEFAPFLRPNQFVNFNSESRAVALASELVQGADTLHEKVTEIFNFVIENISYDVELARTVQSGYVPDIDRVLERGKGICFDYAALMTAMLRSQNIPTRLVTGYAGTAYHAWIDVWSYDSGWISGMIFFDGRTWSLMDPTFAAAGTNTAAGMAAALEFIGDGTNYTALRLF
jgi:transglutaminase-like putative cysteine protease